MNPAYRPPTPRDRPTAEPDRLYRSYSPSRNEGGRPTPHRPVAEGMAVAANQGATAFGTPTDWRLQTTVADWTEDTA